MKILKIRRKCVVCGNKIGEFLIPENIKNEDVDKIIVCGDCAKRQNAFFDHLLTLKISEEREIF